MGQFWGINRFDDESAGFELGLCGNSDWGLLRLLCNMDGSRHEGNAGFRGAFETLREHGQNGRPL